MKPGAIALIQCAVWTAAALRAYFPPPLIEQVPEVQAARYAQRFLEVWLLRWGPVFLPDDYEKVIEAIHATMAPDDRISGQKTKRGPVCRTCGQSTR